ncbi:MAG: DUF6240 domain-containing protein [Agathobacter rectalis]
MTAQRKLEEARLSMTAEANLSLIKGVSIDTEPIERVVSCLSSRKINTTERCLVRAV